MTSMTKAKPGPGEGELKLHFPPQPEAKTLCFPLGAGALIDDLHFFFFQSRGNGTGQP